MTRIQFGWAMPSGSRDKSKRNKYVGNLERGLDLIKGHFASAWFVDHMQFDDGDLMEGWTALTYMAARHEDFHFGHAVLCQSFRNPTLLAKMAATFHFMSGGRFILGMGAGWKEDEYAAYNFPYPPAGVRVEQLEEYLQILKVMWHDEKATFNGKYYSVNDAWCEPKPDPLPTIMIGGSKPKMLRLVARHADWWNVSWTNIDDYREQVVESERACAEIGRDPSTLRRTWFGGCACAPTEAEVEQLTGGKLQAGNAFVGTPEQLLEQMRPFVELGVDYFMLGSAGFPQLTTLEMLVNRVLPELNK
ncbi:MAG: LLM class flavin-dependent oxidoreductase [Chloroflexota bacterium]|nr:LLM class flavin-dependent oxidoreductase [Chloroflexota bacterium]